MDLPEVVSVIVLLVLAFALGRVWQEQKSLKEK